MDKIFVEQLEVECIIGIFDWERKTKQKVLLDMEFPGDCAKSAKTDRIDDTVDYKAISKFAMAYVSKSEYQLVETLADRLACEILNKFQLAYLKLRLSKPKAVTGSQNVGVEIERHRS